jgi:predicted nucleic acid-binding Zn ribbon protein
MYVYHIYLFIHWWALILLHNLTIVNSVAISMDAQVSLEESNFERMVYTQRCVAPFLVFWGNFVLISVMTTLI